MNKEKTHLNTIDSLLGRGTYLDDPNQKGIYFAFPQNPPYSQAPSKELVFQQFKTIANLKDYFDEHDGAVIYPACVRLFDYAYNIWVMKGCNSETIFIPDPKSPL